MDQDHIIIAIKLICLHLTVCFITMVAGCSVSAWSPTPPPEPAPNITDAVAQRLWAWSLVSDKVTGSVDHEFMAYIASCGTNKVEEVE